MVNTDVDEDHGLFLLIPGDVLIQILVWLPVISLLRFKSVCKSWRALIESSFFIHLHATVTTSTCSSSNKFGTFIFQTSPLCDTTETRTFMLTSSRRRSGGEDDVDDEVFEVEDIGFPSFYKTDLGWWRMVGSCNGLICSKLNNRNISLWNPATRQFRLLPKSSLTLEEEKEEADYIHIIDVFGFGFDAKTKDYKVVQIRPMFSLHGNELVEFRVQVYSLSTDSWRVFYFKDDSLFLPKPFQGYFHMSTDGIYLNGSFFFNATYEEDRKQLRHWILSFDFTKEIFTPIKQFPDDPVHSNSTLILTCFGTDKLAFLVQSYSSSREERRADFVYDIWVLNNNEHDQEEEEEEEEEYYYCYWTKLQQSIRISTCDRSWIFPKVISGDGELALIETRCGRDWKLQLFNLVTKEEKTVVFYPTGTWLLRTGVYKPSLVSIIGGGGGGGGNGNGTAACSSSR